jgi:hypothetical protein
MLVHSHGKSDKSSKPDKLRGLDHEKAMLPADLALMGLVVHRKAS